MKTKSRLLVAGILAFALAGCSDSPDMLFHDLAVFWNEIADTMLSVNDEESAKQVLTANGKRYKARIDEFKDRITKNTDPPNGKLNKTEKQDYNGAYVDYYDEMQATGARLTHAVQRLDALIAAIKSKDSSASVVKLTELRNLPCSLNTGKNELAPGYFIVDGDRKKGNDQIRPGIPGPCGGGAMPGGMGGGGPGGPPPGARGGGTAR